LQPPKRISISFIVDSDPVFAYTGWHLTHSLLEHTRLTPADIHVQCLPEVDEDTMARFAALGCNTHRLARFGDGRYCNKVAQWDNLRHLGLDHVVFLDTDMICVADFTVFLPADMIAGKVVDLANPSLPLLDELFRQVGFADRPHQVGVEGSAESTFLGNCNGGLYSVPARFAERLFAAWRFRAKQLLADIEPLRAAGKENHVDQIAFCMALHETGFPFVELPSNVNYCMHFAGPHTRFDGARPLALIHYHNSALNVVGMLQPVGAVEAHERAAAAEANRLICSHFDSRVFWDFRYRHFPERGSGVGSRGENLVYKRDLLRAEGIEVAASVLDIGCGDIEVVGALNLRNYVGLDQSPHILAVARAKRPDWTFLQTPIDVIEPADFVVCFEVLIHQPSLADYRALMELIARYTGRCLIISGYDKAGDHVAANHMLYFHEPLRRSLEATGRFAALRQIGAHSDVVVYRCDVG
jgi:hypothetical protein